jgi:tetratricopeptide (TPR) repeat protein
MKAKNWYRRSTWTSDDLGDFFAHLHRAKRHNRAQYLQIQAIHLKDTGIKANVESAIELLDLLLREYPHPINLENAHYQKAQCFELLGRFNDAVNSYRLAFQSRRNKPNVHTYAPLGFGMFVVRNNRTDLYDETLAIFNEFIDSNEIIFPDAKYMYYSASAIIAERLNQKETARECAKKALQAANTDHSGFSRHPKVGLVKDRDKIIETKLQKILNPNWFSWLRVKE